MVGLSDKVFEDAKVSEVVSLEEYNISVPDLIKLFDNSLAKNQQLLSLNLSNSTLGGFGIILVCQLIKKNQKLEKLTLNNCKIFTHDLADLLKAVSQNATSLKEISLLDNPFDEKAMNTLKNFQLAHPNIKLSVPIESVERNPKDVYASPFEDGSALKGKYRQNKQ